MRLIIRIPTVAYFSTSVEYHLPSYFSCELVSVTMIVRAVHYVKIIHLDVDLRPGRQVVCVPIVPVSDVNGGAALAIHMRFASHRKVSVDVDEYQRIKGGEVAFCVKHSKVRGRVVRSRVIFILNRGTDEFDGSYRIDHGPLRRIGR
jgi:hypothetical protein